MEQEKDGNGGEEDKKLSGSQLRDGITKAKYPHFNPSDQSQLINKIMGNAQGTSECPRREFQSRLCSPSR